MNRRDMLGTLGLATGAAILGPVLPCAAGAKPAAHGAASGVAPTGRARRPWHELGMMSDPILDQVLLFYLGAVWQGAADVGECLETASRVEPQDEGSWSREWRRTAERLRDLADRAARHRLSAGELHLRASTYYRAALHRHPDPLDPDVRAMTERAAHGFAEAMRCLSVPAEAVRMPYEGTTLPGWLFLSPSSRRKAPLLIAHQGRDAWAEDCRFLAEAAMRRGYHCLLFDGPGQGKVIRLQGLAFRPDWERVVTPVVDFAIGTGRVDPRRIALLGISMGGALAPRAAAFEPRLKLCVANPGVHDWSEIVSAFLGAADPGLLALLADPPAFDAAIARLSAQSPLFRWGIRDSLWKHGARTPSELMARLKAFTNQGVAERITCRTLVMDAEADPFSQGKRLYEALRCPKDYLLFTAQDAAETHCQTGALAVGTQRLFDWLDDHL